MVNACIVLVVVVLLREWIRWECRQLEQLRRFTPPDVWPLDDRPSSNGRSSGQSSKPNARS